MEVVRSYRTEGTVDGTTGADGVVGPDVPGADGAVVPDGDPEGIDEPGTGSDGLLSEGADRQSVAGHGYGRRSGLHGDSERLRMDRRWLPPWPRCCFFVTRGNARSRVAWPWKPTPLSRLGSGCATTSGDLRIRDRSNPVADACGRLSIIGRRWLLNQPRWV